MRRGLLGAALGLSALARPVHPCSGPPPLDLELVRLEGASDALDVTLALRPRGGLDAAALAAFAGEPIPDGNHRRVRLDGPAAREPGTAFSISPLGPTPSMLLQWGGFEAASPDAPGRRRGYAAEVHASEPVGLPPPPGWSGPWDPGAERWYAASGRLEDDRAAARWLHQQIGGRVGEESEPWLKLEYDGAGRPVRLHLWVVLAGSFARPEDLWLRLEPDRAESVRVRWDWGDGSTGSGLAGPAEAPLLERLRASHAYAAAGEYTTTATLELDWLYGAWATGGTPWEWSAEVQYIGAVDLEPLAEELSGPLAGELAAGVAAARSRLRCLPGDEGAPGLPGQAPCTHQPADSPDSFLDPSGDAITALLETVLPPSLAGHAATLPVVGEPRQHTLRFRFSGRFPHRSAPPGAPQATRAVWGPSPTRTVVVPASSER